MTKPDVPFPKYFPIYLVAKWMLIVIGLALTPKLLGLF